MVIGLTGPNAAGKGEAALYIKSKGFVYHSLSDILRGEAKKSGIEASRENLIRLGNELRRKNGPAFLAIRVIKELGKTENHIVDSIRNPAEIEVLGKTEDFILLGIDAPVEVRFKRILKRNRHGDPKSLEEFIKKEAEENKSSVENQQLNNCIAMSEETIINDSTIEEFHKKINEGIEKNKKT